MAISMGFAPPLTITIAEVNEMVAITAAAVAEVTDALVIETRGVLPA